MFEEQKNLCVDKVKWVWWFLKEELLNSYLTGGQL